MRQIPLSQGKSASLMMPIILDFRIQMVLIAAISDGVFHWHSCEGIKVDGADRLLYLHRHLKEPGENQETIFLNHDRLDCRRDNLLVVSHEEARQHHRAQILKG